MLKDNRKKHKIHHFWKHHQHRLLVYFPDNNRVPVPAYETYKSATMYFGNVDETAEICCEKCKEALRKAETVEAAQAVAVKPYMFFSGDG